MVINPCAEDAVTPRLVLHIGAMKTGTTYLQNILRENQSALARNGWYVPPHGRTVRAVGEVLALAGASVSRAGVDRASSLTGAPSWLELVETLRARTAQPGTVGAVVSMEFLSFARPAGVELFLEQLDGFDVQVVLTVRDATRSLPSQWNTLTANGYRDPWPAFAVGAREIIDGGRNPAGRPFRRTQDIPRMLRAWSPSVDRDRFSVITVPRSGSGLPQSVLWERFAGVLGTPVDGVDPEVEFDNPQLGYGSCELLRLLNGRLPAPDKSHRRVLRRISRDQLLDLRRQQSRPVTDRTTAASTCRLNERTLELAQQWTTLVGDPADLPVSVADDAPLDPGDRPRPAPEAEVRDAVDAIWDGVLAAPHPATVDRLARPRTDDDLDAAVTGTAELVEALIVEDRRLRDQRLNSR